MFHSSSRQWLAASVLSQSADAFIAYLQQHRFRPGTAQVYVHCIGHFARWLTAERTPLPLIDEVLVERFAAQHLPDCKCPAPCQRSEIGVRAALKHLLRVLRMNHCIADPRFGPVAIQNELERFEAHLDSVGGLAPATRVSRRMWIRKFLLDRFGDGPVSVNRLTARDVSAFLRQQCVGYTPGTARVLGCALRSYLRFRALQYGDAVGPLVDAVPAVAQWRLAPLPACLTDDEVTRFLSAFDRGTANGRRGFAIARCLVDLGLRAGEVAALRLDDVNWREGILRITGGKSRRADVLPLPVATGRAIVEYLFEARPASTSRALFLRHRAPLDVPIGAAIVRGTVSRALLRCGLADRYTGTHVLRHTAAQRMLCGGASLKQVADVLRHRSLDTTTIYTKVDLPRLVALAAPWPEERS